LLYGEEGVREREKEENGWHEKNNVLVRITKYKG
jgi:hypothetical protein